MNVRTLDLHGIFRDGSAIATALGDALKKAKEERVEMIEIIPGKGSGALRRTVIAFLHQAHMQKLYKRLEIDERNRGMMRVYL